MIVCVSAFYTTCIPATGKYCNRYRYKLKTKSFCREWSERRKRLSFRDEPTNSPEDFTLNKNIVAMRVEAFVFLANLFVVFSSFLPPSWCRNQNKNSNSSNSRSSHCHLCACVCTIHLFVQIKHNLFIFIYALSSESICIFFMHFNISFLMPFHSCTTDGALLPSSFLCMH